MNTKKEFVRRPTFRDMEQVVGVQQKVRENAGEVTDYLKDLDSWTKQMEVKDEQLKKAKKGAAAAGKTKQESPPKKLKTEMKIDKDPPKKGTKIQIEDADAKRKINEVGKIKSYDYAAWDKFDVEAACEEVGKVAAEEKEEEDEEEEMAEESRRVEAVAEKERGNTAFKAGNWDRAIERYTRGEVKHSVRISVELSFDFFLKTDITCIQECSWTRRTACCRPIAPWPSSGILLLRFLQPAAR